MRIYHVWYSKANGEYIMAWQSLTYVQAWRNVKELEALGYQASVVTPSSNELLEG